MKVIAREKNFEKLVKDFLRSQGCYFIKYWGGGEFTKAGVPDILACVHGQFFGIEIKAEKGKPSPLQIYNLKKIDEAGGHAILLYPDDFDRFKLLIYGKEEYYNQLKERWWDYGRSNTGCSNNLYNLDNFIMDFTERGKKIMDRFHFSTAECFENCPARWSFRYREGIETLESDDPANALKIGTALHRGVETDVETALHEYFMSYPVITDAHINEAIKLEHWISRVKDLVPDGSHEVQMQSDWYEGTMDLLVPCTKHDTDLPHGQFDLYDFKYSNNQQHYMESRQLHVYKYFCEQITGKRIRNMFFVFVPKTNIRQKKTESLEDFRKRIQQEIEAVDVEIKQVEFNPMKVIEFFETCMKVQYSKDFPKVQSYLCDWCEYKEFCLKGEDHMILPSSERRQVGKTTKRKLWIYGGAFSGKTTFMDSAPTPLNLNTDGNVQFVTMPYLSIKDSYEGRIKVLAWENFKKAIDELEKKDNDFQTIIVDLLEDTYESCRLYMYDKLGISHESDDSFRAWDKVRTEFLSTIRKLMNLDYENIVLISHEDTTKDITRKSGDKITAIKPNIADKVANKIAGMVDIVARVVVEDDDSRTLNFKSNEVIFGGGRLKGISKTQIPLDWNELCAVYDEANGTAQVRKPVRASQKGQEDTSNEKVDNSPVDTEKPVTDDSDKPQTAQTDLEGAMNPPETEEQEEKPVRKRRTRKTRVTE